MARPGGAFCRPVRERNLALYKDRSLKTKKRDGDFFQLHARLAGRVEEKTPFATPMVPRRVFRAGTPPAFPMAGVLLDMDGRATDKARNTKGRSIRSGLSSLFSVHARCHCPPVSDGDG